MAAKQQPKNQLRPPQEQRKQPGVQSVMRPQPESIDDTYRGSGKLKNRVAIITGGDSGIGRAVALAFAQEGADVAVLYFNEHKDAKETARLVEETGRKCLLLAGDIGKEPFCKKAVTATVKKLGRLDIVWSSPVAAPPFCASKPPAGKMRSRSVLEFWLFTQVGVPGSSGKLQLPAR